MFKDIYKSLSDELLDGKEAVLLTFLNTKDDTSGSISKKLLFNKDHIKEKNSGLSDDLNVAILDSFEKGTPHMFKLQEETILIEPFFPKPRLIILGGGHIAKPLVEFGNKVGFSVVVVDDRPSFANWNRFPEASQVICESFERAFDSLHIRISDFVVIVTRGHRHDGVCLRSTLKYNPTYIGMIGSKRRVAAMMDEFLEEGYSKEQLDKVHSPIGLSIGAVTPDEIAISIIAEVIGVRRAIGNVFDTNSNKKFNWPEFDADVMKEISNISDTPRALITITSSKGSVPRKAGAKMILWQDGRIMGSIGGGCSEAGILTLAMDIIINRGFKIEHVDMTGEVAENEGMVCGGTMEVLIETF